MPTAVGLTRIALDLCLYPICTHDRQGSLIVDKVNIQKAVSPGDEESVLILKSDLGIMQLTEVQPLPASEDWPVLHLTQHITNPTVNTQVSSAKLASCQLTASLGHFKKSSLAPLAQPRLYSSLSCFVTSFLCDHNYAVKLQGEEALQKSNRRLNRMCACFFLFCSASHCICFCFFCIAM